MTGESPPSRRFWRFGLRELLGLTVVLGILLVVLAPHVRNALQQWHERQAELEPGRRQHAFNSAILSGNIDQVRQGLEAGANLMVPMDDGSSPLNGAITRGQCEIVQVILEHGADVEQIAGYNSRPRRQNYGGSHWAERMGPALFAAVDCDQPPGIKIEMIRLLLAHGADIRCEVPHKIENQVFGTNLMDLAAQRGDGDLVDFLRGHGLPYGPREMAALNRLEEVKRALQESPGLLQERFKPFPGANSALGPEFQVSTLLGIALRNNNRDMARMFIEAGAPLDALEPDGKSPLHIAVMHSGNLELTRMLIEAGAPLDVQDEVGQTPLHIAATYGGDPKVIRLLIAHGADLNAKNDYQRTPLEETQHWTGREAAKAALMEAGAK